LTPIIQEDVQHICQDLSAQFQLLSGTTLLVTGGSGFLCSYCVETVAALNRSTLRSPCRVIVVDNLRTGVPERIRHLVDQSEVRVMHHDVSQPLDLGENVDWIIHGASIASPTFYRRYPLETIDVNVTGTRHMLDLARRTGARGLLYLSTSEVYGDPDPASVPTPEDYRGNVSCTGPRACYDESKRLAETLCVTYYRLFGLPVNIVRPFNVYGPGQRLDDRRIIPDLIGAVLRREPIVLYSDGRASRAFCYISDAVCAMWHVLLTGEGGEIFNVGNDEEEISIQALADRASRLVEPGVRVDFRVSDDVHYVTDNPQRRCPDLRKLRSRFPWRPRVSLAEGLARTLRSYLVPVAT
jgi:UDP-glucuronate decarboxylase